MFKRIAELARRNISGSLYARWRLGRFAIVPYRNTQVSIGGDCRTAGSGTLRLGPQWTPGRPRPSLFVMHPRSSLEVHGSFAIYSGHTIWVNPGATLALGSGFINNNLNLSCFERIEIGERVAISENVTIRDSDDHSIDGSEPARPIKIGNNVWIGINATILKGVTIGDGSVVAAGAVVIRDVPARSLVAGVPAVVKRIGVDWC